MGAMSTPMTFAPAGSERDVHEDDSRLGRGTFGVQVQHGGDRNTYDWF